MTTDHRLYSARYFLTPGECNAQQLMPLPLLVERIIEIATLHADSLDIGYPTISREGNTWVLSRLAIEMKRWPRVDEYYELTTWVENFGRFWSDRNLAIADADGNTIGYARTVWVIMNMETRRPADLTIYPQIEGICNPEAECPIDRPAKLAKVESDDTVGYTFQYSDIDFNRHVNSCRYIELLLNCWPMDWHDEHPIARVDINYLKEAHYGEQVSIMAEPQGQTAHAEIVSADGTSISRAAFRFAP